MRADGSRRKWWRRSGGCRSDAASLSGGKFGRCRAVTLAPLLMVLLLSSSLMLLLLWNVLSAIFEFCCFSSNSLQVLLFLLVWFIYVLLHWCCWYRVALIERGLIKVLHSNYHIEGSKFCIYYSKFCCPNWEIRLCFLRDIRWNALYN